MARSARPKKGGDGKRPRRVPSEITAERERRAWDLRQQFWTQEQIARELKIAQPAVCKALQRIERRVLAELTEEIAQVKSRQTAQLERVAAEAFQGWLASRRDTVTTKTTAAAVETMARTNAGAPAFLSEARGALSDIRKIWGVEPKGDEPIGDDANPPHPAVVAAMARGIAEGLKAAETIEGSSE